MKRFSFSHLSKRLSIAGTVVLLALGALLPATAFAASNQSQGKCAAADVKCVIAAGDTLITKRLNALDTLKNKITTTLNNHKITSDQASALQTDVSNNRTGLTGLKTRLDAETQAQTARQDVTSIFTQYRIYAVVLPRDYRTLEMDIEINAKTVMEGAAPAIKTAIGSAPAGKQSQLNTLYSDYQLKVAAAQAQIDIAQKDFPALTPENFNQHRAAYLSTRQDVNSALRVARDDLREAARDLKRMATILGIKV